MLDSLGIRHLALKVKNFEECLVFYTQVLGMEVDWKPDDQNVYLTNGIDNLALHYDENISDVKNDSRLDHFGIFIKNKDDIDINYMNLSKKMLSKDILNSGFKPSFDTHDDRIIDCIINEAERNLISSDTYEFNMLYGIRKKLQKEILESNQNLKILISYGEQWFPWYIRRIAENPKNLFLLLK